MASSDYLAIKKRKHIQAYPNDRSSSAYLQNQQYFLLKNAVQIDEDGDWIYPTRFNISLPSDYSLSFLWNNRLINGYATLYSIPRIHVPEYIKNRYQAPFCWTCFTPYGEIMQEIACSLCDELPRKSVELQNHPDPPLFQLIKNPVIDIGKIIADFENSDNF
jgi:hypothetical protein